MKNIFTLLVCTILSTITVGFVFGAAPTVSSSGLNFTNVQGDRMTVNWTNGNGATRIVVARQSSSVTFAPVNGVDYASYQSLGSGEVIVYKGTGSSFNFTTLGSTNLYNNTTYYFAIYEYNGSGTGTEYLMSALTGSNTTLPIASKPVSPINSASIVPFQGTFNGQPQQRMDISWSGGSGQRSMIIMRAGSAVDPSVLPADGTTSRQWKVLPNNQIICYYGTGNSMTLKSDGFGNLASNTMYYFLFVTLNGDGTTSSYLTSSYYTASAKTLINAPTVNTSNLTFSNVQTNQMTLNWTSGNGANRIIVAKQGSSPTFVPANGTSYSLNTSLGANEYVVYNGSGNTYTLNNGSVIGPITSNTNYYFAIYEYNGSGTSCNYATPGLTGNQLTLASSTAPTIAASNLIFTNVQANQMTLNWTAGNGSSRILIMRQGSAVSAMPVNGTSYSNYQSLGSGNMVLYSGSGTSFAFRNDGNGPLTIGTNYFFAIFEYNGSASTTNYLTSSFLAGNQFTSSLSAEPTVPCSALSFTNIHSYSMMMNWTSGNGSTRMVVLNQGSPVTFVPVDGVYYSNYQSLGSGDIVILNGSASSMNVTNNGNTALIPSTTYYYAIFEYNGASGTNNYLTSSYLTGNQTTLASGRFASENDITDASSAFDLQVYPVPATSKITIETTANHGSRELLFFNHTGDLMNRMYIQTGSTVDIDLSSWARGMYFLKISDESGDIMRKIILQ